MAWLRQRTDFKPDEFMRIIIQKGYYMVWEKSSSRLVLTLFGFQMTLVQ
jgi:hypothetical protein